MVARRAGNEERERGAILWLNGKGFASGMCACSVADLRDGAVLSDLAAVVRVPLLISKRYVDKRRLLASSG